MIVEKSIMIFTLCDPLLFMHGLPDIFQTGIYEVQNCIDHTDMMITSKVLNKFIFFTTFLEYEGNCAK